MQNTMNYRGVIRYEYSIVKPGIFARIINYAYALMAHIPDHAAQLRYDPLKTL